MTDRKQSAGESAEHDEVEQKVTTGAWWKSAFELFPRKKQSESDEEQQVAESATVREESRESVGPATREDDNRPAAAPEGENRGRPPEEGAETGRQAPAKRPRRHKRGQRQRPAASREEPVRQEQEQPQTGENVVTKLLVNAEEPEECRIALIENGRLESFHVTSVVHERTKNNIYKGIIVSTEPNLQAAFVDVGLERNGFLPFDEIHPEYYREDVDERSRKLIADQQWKKLKIENVVRKGQEVLVQVVKEATGSKGANITTYLSIPGRYLVLMPGSDSAGISRKIAGDEKRFELREMMSNFAIPEGIGYIIRTASIEITKTSLQKDLRYLLRLWEEIKKKGQELKAPALLYEDLDIVVRFLRDHFVP